ncbi:hypothetical protein [Agrobacterium tumefaciens]|uniref:hypothetical protein n=1 Tax=Agrobacterium tumefaciens TaxID=358 RepID=UPI001573081A|nr:hypothetical protein [Agrobacterium tumefaciens]
MTDHEKPRKTSPLDQIMRSFTFADMKARAEDLAYSTVISREEMQEFMVLRNWIAHLRDHEDDATFVLDDGGVLDGGRPVELFGIPYRLYPDSTTVLQVNKTISLTYKERALVAEAIENLIQEVTSAEEERLLSGVLERLRGPGRAIEHETPAAPAYPWGKP